MNTTNFASSRGKKERYQEDAEEHFMKQPAGQAGRQAGRQAGNAHVH